MSKIHIKRAINIDGPVSKIYEVIGDFKSWKSWSPWLVLEPEAKLDFAQDGQSFRWEGKRLGSGSMKITNQETNRNISCDLHYVKPFRSKAKVYFSLKEQENGVEVTWVMDSSLPFFLFWMRKPMIAQMNADYDRGLTMLKAIVEIGEVPSSIELEGRVDFEGCSYIGVTTECSIEEIAGHMSEDLKNLSIWMDNQGIDIVGEPMTIYHKMDRVKGRVAFTVAIPAAAIPYELPRPFHKGFIPPIKTYKILHEGHYKFLSNAWSTGYAMVRSKEIRLLKGHPPFEVYLNNPQDTADELLETALYFPCES